MLKPDITICIQLFAAYQEAYGVSQIKLQFPENTPVEAVCDRMIAEHPELAKWRDVTRYGINLAFVEPSTPLNDGDEVVLIPPVSGG